jgi:clan AA aspartic protease (TIGR02281 family)
MRTLLAGLGLLIAGWLLGWYSHERWGHGPVAPVVQAPAGPLDDTPPPRGLPVAVDAPVDVLQTLLSAGQFDDAVGYYEALARRADEAGAQLARQQLLGHARELLGQQRYVPAEALLQRLLVAAWRDVEVRALLAEVSYSMGDGRAAIDRLYEARGHAWDPETRSRLTRRIRVLASGEAKVLHDGGDQAGLLELYQHLTQLEPDHAEYFIGLAGAQHALGDTGAALRSLQLVAHDPVHGAQVTSMLVQLQHSLADRTDEAAAPAAGVAGIPLQRRGNHFLVEAAPGRGRSLNLLIDTGASMTIVTPAALGQRGIRYSDTGRTGVFSTANGRVRAPIYRIDTLSVGEWQVPHLEIGVLDLGNRTDIDGLLGMNFLRHFQFFIDQNRSLLRLSLQGSCNVSLPDPATRACSCRHSRSSTRCSHCLSLALAWTRRNLLRCIGTISRRRSSPVPRSSVTR